MREIFRPAAEALTAVCVTLAFAIASSGGALAQAKQAPATQPPATQAAPPQPAPQKQINLSDKQIEGVLASQKDLDAITEKLAEGAADKPDPKIVAQLDEVAKKNGFASYDEYNDVVEMISLVLGGFDPQTKAYVGPEAVIKGQIAAVQADKKMSAKDKKEALKELNQALKTPPPPVENKANIDVVGKYYDKLAAALQEE